MIVTRLAALKNRIGDSLSYHTNRVLLSCATSKPFACRSDLSVVTFTFDDFPASAYERGGKVLEAHGTRGTFYASVGRMETGGGAGSAIALLGQVHEAGHEIGCHTYSHLDCVATQRVTLQQDIDRNREALATVGGGVALSHFAYPFGRVSYASRRRLGLRFRTCRGIFPGINADSVDLALLRANKLYNGPRTLARARRLVAEVGNTGGWLIFFTHDVSETPSPFGCTPAVLDELVQFALRARCAVAPIGQALAHLTQQAVACPS